MIFVILTVGIYISLSEGTITIQGPSAGNCNEDSILTCQTTGNIRNTGWYGLNRSLMINGVPVRPEDNKKYTETRRSSSFTLTIHNTSITDEGYYKCKNGFDESQFEHLKIECKASSATHIVTSGKKIQITVDKLYPASPSVTATFERQNSASKIPGSQACSSSAQYTGYYRCMWTSSNSLDYGVYTYSVVVTTITQASPIKGLFKIAPPETPLISNIQQLNTSRNVVYGNEGQSLTIKCTSNGGHPTATLAWYKNSISSSNQLASTSSGTLQSDGTYTINLQHTFTPGVSDDRKYLICRSYYPRADSAHVGSNNKSVLLYLALKPSLPTVTQTSVVSAGSNVTVRCRTSGCRPAASISWLYQGVKYNDNTTSTSDDVTETFTVVSEYNRQVTAEDNGRSLQCIVTHPALVSTPQLTKSTNLTVSFPPKVSVVATNTSVKEPNTVLKCIAKGFPDSNYRYGNWIQRWPGSNVPVSVRPGSALLELTNLTYEHSGYYTCSASNGIKIFRTNTEFIEGKSVQLLVKSFPVIITLDEKIASRMNRNITVEIDFFSNVAGSDVKVYKGAKTDIVFFVNQFPIEIELPVLSHIVKTNGTRAIVKVPLKSEVGYGLYTIMVTNEIGSGNGSFQVMPTEPPSSPGDFTIDYIQHNKARLSWRRGFDGGLVQTFVIQLGTDGKWSDVEIVDNFADEENRISTILAGLHDASTYFVRVYAYNEEGNSPLSETLNFTTSSIEVNVTVETNNTALVIMGVVLGLVIVTLVIYSSYVTVRMKRSQENDENKGICKHASSKKYENIESSMKCKRRDKNEENTSDIQASESQYTELDKDLREADSAYDAISTL